jgi:hypothetical protein
LKCVPSGAAKIPIAIFKGSVYPLKSSAGIIKSAVLELTVDEDMFLNNEGDTC